MNFTQAKYFGLKTRLLLVSMALIFSLNSLMFVFPASIAGAAPPTPVPALTLKSTKLRMGEPIIISGVGFSPDEKIAFWLTSPDNSVIEAGYVNATRTGSFTSFPLKGGDAAEFAKTLAPYGPGIWALTANGLSSNTTLVVNFTVLDTILQVTALNIGNSVVVAVYAGANWYPLEKVELWVTDGVGNTIGLGYAFADQRGKIPDPTSYGFAFGGTAGYYYLTALGEISNIPKVVQFVAPTLGS